MLRFYVDIDIDAVAENELPHLIDTMRDALREAAIRHISYTVPTPWPARVTADGVEHRG